MDNIGNIVNVDDPPLIQKKIGLFHSYIKQLSPETVHYGTKFRSNASDVGSISN